MHILPMEPGWPWGPLWGRPDFSLHFPSSGEPLLAYFVVVFFFKVNFVLICKLDEFKCPPSLLTPHDSFGCRWSYPHSTEELAEAF